MIGITRILSVGSATLGSFDCVYVEGITDLTDDWDYTDFIGEGQRPRAVLTVFM